MSKFRKVAAVLISGCFIAGCVSHKPSTSTTIEFETSPNSTFAFSNKKSQVFPEDVSVGEKARLLFGYPTVKDLPMGFFGIPGMKNSPDWMSELNLAEGWTEHKSGSGGRSIRAEDGLVAGANLARSGLGGAGAGFAVAGLLLGGSSDPDLDARQVQSSAICFIPLSDVTTPQAAVDKCGAMVMSNFTAALAAPAHQNQEVALFVSGTLKAGVSADKVTLAVIKDLPAVPAAYYSKGLAPQEIGGYPSHIAHVRIGVGVDRKSNDLTIERLAEAIVKDKPKNVAYMFRSGALDARRKGLEPLGYF